MFIQPLLKLTNPPRAFLLLTTLGPYTMQSSLWIAFVKYCFNHQMFCMHFSFCSFFIATAIFPIVINWRLIAKQTFYYFYITVSYKNWLCLPTPNHPAALPPTKPLLPEKFLLILFTNYEHSNLFAALFV